MPLIVTRRWNSACNYYLSGVYVLISQHNLEKILQDKKGKRKRRENSKGKGNEWETKIGELCHK